MNPRIRTLVALGLILALLAVSYFVLTRNEESSSLPPDEPIATPAPAEPELPYLVRTIGTSVESRAIEAYTFGSGPTHLVFVGGIHGGYEWNSVLLAYEMIDHLTLSRDSIPEYLTVSIIPNANPDGLFAVLKKEGRFTAAEVVEPTVIGTGRFNANGVDLNRNFDCKWKPESSWRGKTVSAGSAPFSEPEAQALRDFVLAVKPAGVVFWHSQANAVYASECTEGILPGTRTLMNLYATAAGYPAVDTFDAYPVTGDAEGWLASVGIPAITVELRTHETIEWDKNLGAVNALFAHYGSPALAR